MFSRLGLRYVLFTEKGSLRGMLTKKDIWYILESPEEDGSHTTRGALREDYGGESRGLLNRVDSGGLSDRSPTDDG